MKDLEASAENDGEQFEEITSKLQIAYENSKSKSEDLEKQIVYFREEILKIKSEKKVVRKEFETENEKCEVLFEEINGLKEKCLKLQEELKSESKLLT